MRLLFTYCVQYAVRRSQPRWDQRRAHHRRRRHQHRVRAVRAGHRRHQPCALRDRAPCLPRRGPVRYGSPDSAFTHSDFYVIEFDVRPACGPSSPIPFLSAVNSGVDAPCTLCPPHVCASESTVVYLHGEFPNASYALVGVFLARDPVIPTSVPRLRIEYSRGCVGAMVPVPWSATVTIPLPTPGPTAIPVSAFLRDDCNPSQSHGGRSARRRTRSSSRRLPGAAGLRHTASFFRQPGPATSPSRGGRWHSRCSASTAAVAIGGVQAGSCLSLPGLHVQSIEPAYAGSILKWDPHGQRRELRGRRAAGLAAAKSARHAAPGDPNVVRRARHRHRARRHRRYAGWTCWCRIRRSGSPQCLTRRTGRDRPLGAVVFGGQLRLQ